MKLVVFLAAFALIFPAHLAMRVPFITVVSTLATDGATLVGAFAKLVTIAA